MKNVKVCRLGFFNYSADFAKLKDWRSQYFAITETSAKADINPNHFNDLYVYPSKSIAADMGNVEQGTDLQVAIIDQPLEGNFYMHRIDANRVVISLFPVIHVLSKANIPVENYIIRCIYEMVVFLYEGGGQLDEHLYQIPHHETRGCLFDMNVFIEGIIYSADKPNICDDCKVRLRRCPLPDGFIQGIVKELRKIRKPLYYRLEAIIKRHPVESLLIASAFAIFLNVAASFIYDKIK